MYKFINFKLFILKIIVFLTVSIGVALQKNDELLDQVMKRADLALYTAKKNGRNRVEIHS